MNWIDYTLACLSLLIKPNVRPGRVSSRLADWADKGLFSIEIVFLLLASAAILFGCLTNS